MSVDEVILKMRVAIVHAAKISWKGGCLPLEHINYKNVYSREFIYNNKLLNKHRESRKFYDFPC